MKINRNYEFVLTCMENGVVPQSNELTGEVMFKSECHYYAEKEIISCIKDAEKRENIAEYYDHTYAIYKRIKPRKEVTKKVEDGKEIVETVVIPGEATLIEIITVDENGVNIR